MKFLQICITALTIGVCAAACRNNTCPPVNDATATTTSSSVTTTPADGTAAPAANADTMAAANAMPANNNGGGSSGGTGKMHTHTTAGRNVMARATGKDTTMSASRKREGNFTNGTGSDNPGK